MTHSLNSGKKTTVTRVKYCDAFHAVLRGDMRAMSAKELSQTISFARIALIVGLVFLHYHFYPNSRFSPRSGENTEYQIATLINSFFVFFFFSVVPLLSMVSGWLFFSFATDPDADVKAALIHRIRRRLLSLYLPLVFWNTLFLVILLLLFVLDPAHMLLGELEIDFNAAGALDYMNAVFGITDHPIGFQFWFVRDLFVTVLVSPLLWLLLRMAPYKGMVFFGLVWISGGNLWIFLRGDVPFFFYLGGLLRIRGSSLEIGRRATVALISVYVVLVALRTLIPYFVDMQPQLLSVATRGVRLVGVVACWGVFLHVALTPLGAIVARYGGLAFFLHAAHYPLLGEVKIILRNFIPAETDFWMLAHYAASVAVTVVMGISGGMLLARWAPNWFALFNGGRTLS